MLDKETIINSLQILNDIEHKINIIETYILSNVKYYDSDFSGTVATDYHKLWCLLKKNDYFIITVECDYDWYDGKTTDYDVKIPIEWLEKSDDDLQDNAQQYIDEIQKQFVCE